MLFGLELTDVIRTIGLLGVAIMVFAESGLLIGFFLPGDTLLFSAGLLASKGLFGVNVHIVTVTLIIAAIAGQSVGYWFGRKVGPRLFTRQNSILFHPDNIARAEAFYKKHGVLTILLARFVPVVRTFAPIVAGAARMDYRQFTLHNILGAIIWVGSVTYVGYFAGGILEAHGIDIDKLILPVIGVVVLVTFASPLLHQLSTPEGRMKLRQRFKRS